MKLEVPQKCVGKISSDLTNKFLSRIKPEHWLENTARNQMGNLTQTESIIFRFFTDYEHAKHDDWEKHIINFKMYDVYKDLIDEAKDELKKYYNFKNYMCFLAKLIPHGQIGRHSDGGEFLETCHRVHIPLKTNPDVYYIIEGKPYYWEANNIYEFDNTRQHEVMNASSEERIHLMFNLYD
jgi:hypothetical protein